MLKRCRGIACEADEARRERARTPRAALGVSAMDGANNAPGAGCGGPGRFARVRRRVCDLPVADRALANDRPRTAGPAPRTKDGCSPDSMLSNGVRSRSERSSYPMARPAFF